MPKLLLLIFTFLFIYTKQSFNYDSRFFYCNGRIYCDNNGLSQSDITSLCSKITSDDRYVILFTNKDRFTDERSYSYNSEEKDHIHIIVKIFLVVIVYQIKLIVNMISL